MAQTSGPWASAPTLQQRQFTDVMWGDLFGHSGGIVQDYDGSAYKLTLSTTGDTATVGSDTEDSLSAVGGFNHTIPKGQPVTLTIPAATGAAQTTVIAVRYDPSYTDAPGPCRLVTYPSPGTADGKPLRSSLPEGVEVMPLHAVTRQPAQVLSNASVVSLRRWVGPQYVVTELPAEAPLGSVAYLPAQRTRIRQLVGGAPTWVNPLPVAQAPMAISGLGEPAAFGDRTIQISSFTLTQAARVAITASFTFIIGSLQQLLVQIVIDGQVVGTAGAIRTLTSTAEMQDTATCYAADLSLAAGVHTFGVNLLVFGGSSNQLIRGSALIIPSAP